MTTGKFIFLGDIEGDTEYLTTGELAYDMLSECKPDTRVSICIPKCIRKGGSFEEVNIYTDVEEECVGDQGFVLVSRFPIDPWYDHEETPDEWVHECVGKYLAIVKRGEVEEPEVVYFDGDKWDTDGEIVYWMEIPE